MRKIVLYLFILVTAGELLSHALEVPAIHLICKPALLVLLMIYYVLLNREIDQPLSRTLILALFFSWGGDVLLMKSDEMFFILGLVSFLISHVFYIFTFRQFREEDDAEALHGLQKVRFAFPVILYGTGL
ncbi:MAG: lysoplasmalogenase, partial [Cyclobacteriaceae bacterium]|nr:lysoplasmalogenase [Cyclobacteriaceae bacterium]